MLCKKSFAGGGQRPGFTLIELLVIIAILAALAALTAGATLRFITVQQQNNTKTALSKIQTAVNNQVSASVRQWQKDPIPGTVQSYIQTNLAGTDANSPARVRVIYVKLKLRQMFPETFAEAFNPAPLPPLQSYQKYLAQYGISGNTGGQYASSVCLAMVLQNAVGTGFSMDELGKGGALATAPVDPPTPGGQAAPSAPMLIDAWGTPICFSRFPSGCPTTNPNGPQNGANDRLDPAGTLNNPNWSTTYQNSFSTLVLQDLAPAGMSYNYWPVVASAGPDKQFGLTMYNFATASPAQAADNLYSTP